MKIVSKDGIYSPNQKKAPEPAPSKRPHPRQRPKSRPKPKSSVNLNLDVSLKSKKNEKAPLTKPISKPPSPKNNVQKEPKKNTVSNRVAQEADTLYNRFISLLRFNITFKLTVGYSLRLIRFIVFFVLLCYGAFTYYLYFDADNQLNHHQRYLNAILVDSSTTKESIEKYLNHNNLQIYIYDDTKTQLYSNTSEVLVYDAAIKEERFVISRFPSFPQVVTYDVLDISPFENGKYYALHLNRIEAEETIRATFPVAIVLAIASILTAITSSSRLAQKHLKPIHTITEQVQEMSANNLSTRINISGTKDELKDLASTFNTMLDDIQQSYEREKQFVSDASHELRTPIAVIKGYGGMLKRWGKDDPNVLEESIDAIVGETNNMQSLVESLLFIARNDKGTLKMDMENFNLSLLLEEIVKETHLIDSDHKITDQLDSGLSVYGSNEKIKQALRIFIDNSIKYTPNDGEIKIKLSRTADFAILSISDNGIGISKEDLPHIFDRFYRADKSRTKMKDNQHGGTGLGLSIAKIIIEQHNGSIKVSSDLNVGTEFLIKLPLQA